MKMTTTKSKFASIALLLTIAGAFASLRLGFISPGSAAESNNGPIAKTEQRPVGPGAKILSPLDYQVIQRDTDNEADVSVVIEAPRVNGKVSARLLLQPTFTEYQPYAGKTTDWVELTPTDTGYVGTLHGDGGGWYQLEV